ncbi:hypothetical protein BN863_11400 [Formosa agariphila KMM 3901]|uniref:Uncharacterized protein n=1 Tax=Formosa agariphila (strain DSM 15362 / KCTC 12365 / LMG 23005 / KMM 3901 / M-2Alg 35-1) TaxID=1347342 RepID=T2KJ00_FORAG|nr:hypothetical protein BN863_11400 [Formosa agariphila KMM 3901]
MNCIFIVKFYLKCYRLIGFLRNCLILSTFKKLNNLVDVNNKEAKHIV